MLGFVGDGASLIYNNFLEYELMLIHGLQDNFEKFEPIFEFVSEEMTPHIIVSYLVPLLGLISMDAMVKYTYIMSMILLSSNLLKWFIHEDRPYWWCREKNLPSILQYRLTCETTSGIPSGHSAGIVAISCLLFAYVNTSYKNILYIPLLTLCIIMFLARIYFGCHFLHQCLFGALIAYTGVKYMLNPYIWQYLLEASKKFHIIILLCIGLTTLISYFIMILMDIDPHWSVRMAFKWCQDPMYLSHMNSPVYTIFREFGFIMGIALSAPLIRRTSLELNPYVSVPITISLMIANTILKHYTPTQSGRLAFVTYGFVRSLCFSFSLLTIMPKLAMKQDIKEL